MICENPAHWRASIASIRLRTDGSLVKMIGKTLSNVGFFGTSGSTNVSISSGHL
jgi:hypothetical protein